MRGLSLPAVATLWVVAVVVATWSPLGLAGGLLVALPWLYHPVPIDRLRFSHLELAILAGTCAVAIHGVAALWHRDRRAMARLLPQSRITLPALALLLVATVSLRTVADPRHITESLREYRTVIVEPLLAFLIFRWTLATASARWYAVACLLAGAAAVTLVAVTGNDLVIANGVSRITGPYPHPNNLAFYLERVALVGLGMAAIANRRRLWWLMLGLTLVSGIGTLLTVSRGALLALFAGGFYLGIQARIRPWLQVAGVVAAAGVIVLLVGSGRLTATGANGTQLSRLPIWRSSIEMIREFPITGVGLDQFLYQYWPRYVEPAGWPERYTAHPHNLVLDLWLRLGVLGPLIGLWLVLVVWSVRSPLAGYSGLKSFPGRLAGIAALIGGLVHGMVDHGYFLPDIAVLTWFCLALLEPPADLAS